MAAPTWVAAGTKGEVNGSSVNASAPAGHATADLLIIACNVYAGLTLTTPAGWTLLADSTNWGGHRTYLFWKLAASGSEATVTLTPSGSGFLDAQMYAFRGANQTTPIDVNVGFTAVSSAQAVPTPAMTTVTNDALMVYLGVSDTSFAWNTPPAGATERHESSTYGAVFIVATETKAVAGTEAADTYVRSNSGGSARIAGFAIRPTGPPPSTFVPQITVVT